MEGSESSKKSEQRTHFTDFLTPLYHSQSRKRFPQHRSLRSLPSLHSGRPSGTTRLHTRLQCGPGGTLNDIFFGMLEILETEKLKEDCRLVLDLKKKTIF